MSALGALLALVVASGTGWIATILLAVTIALPYLLRRGGLGAALGLVGPGPLLVRLRPHYWIGYGIGGLALGHALVEWWSGFVWRVDLVGIVLALGALAAIGAQVLLGRRLSRPRAPRRGLLQRWHFWTMAGLVALTAAHLVLDGPMVRAMLGLA